MVGSHPRAVQSWGMVQLETGDGSCCCLEKITYSVLRRDGGQFSDTDTDKPRFSEFANDQPLG